MVRLGATGPGEAPAIEEALAGDLKQNAGQTNLKRAIPLDYKYDPSAIKPMAKMLWSMSVSLGHALSAHKTFVRLKSATISPDGLLGGRGYVMAVKDVRTMLHDACEALSALCDTVHDEINAPHWQPKLGQLEKADVEKIKDLLNEAQGYLDDPDELVNEEEEQVESGHGAWHHPAVEKDNKRKKEPKSELPGGGARETSPQAQPLRHDMRKAPNPQNEKTASADPTWLPTTTAERVAAKFLQSNSSLPVETMPGGPRIDHLDRGDTDQTAPFGTYDNEHGKPDDEEQLSDKWRRDDGFGHDYNYPSDWDNDLHEKQAAVKVDPNELAKLKSVAHKHRWLQDLADALEAGNWRLADQWYQMLRAAEALHDVPEGIAGQFAIRNKHAELALGYAFFPPETDLATALPAFMSRLHAAVDPDNAPMRYPPPGFERQQAGWTNSWQPWTNSRSPSSAQQEAAVASVLDNMIKDLQNRKKLEVTNPRTNEDFFVIMKEPKKDKFRPNPTPWYAPSKDGRKPEEPWRPMEEHELRGWLQLLRPRPHAVAAAVQDPWSAFATSAIPDSNSDKTPTEGFDFGIGDGNGDEARGQAAGGYGEGNPGAPDSNPGGGTGNRGVYGPQSGLPKDPGGKVNPDEGDSTGTIENEIGGKGRYADLRFKAVRDQRGDEIVGTFKYGEGDPWAVKNDLPGTVTYGAPDFQEATRPDPPGTDIAPEATSLKLGWYDGVYDFERPVEPVGQTQEQAFLDPGYTFSGSPLPMGPQEPFVGMFMEPEENFDSGTSLPGDDNPGVARTDYFVEGDKPQNMQNTAPSNVGVTRLPGQQMPAKPTPTVPRPQHNYEHEFATYNPLATGELPGDGQRVDYDFNMDVGPDQTTRFEQMNTPYIKWDYNTPEMRPDPIHQRDPIQGPYVHNDLTERPSNG